MVLPTWPPAAALSTASNRSELEFSRLIEVRGAKLANEAAAKDLLRTTVGGEFDAAANDAEASEDDDWERLHRQYIRVPLRRDLLAQLGISRSRGWSLDEEDTSSDAVR